MVSQAPKPVSDAPAHRKSSRTTVREHNLQIQLHRTGDLAGAQAAGAHINMSGSAVHNRLDTLDIGLPGTVAAAMRMGNLDTEGNALIAEITLSHIPKPPR